jgi:hypothetical protein
MKPMLVVPVTKVDRFRHPVLDAHGHAYAEGAEVIAEWVRLMDQVGVQTSFILTGSTGEKFRALAGAYANAHPGRFILFSGFEREGVERSIDLSFAALRGAPWVWASAGVAERVTSSAPDLNLPLSRVRAWQDPPRTVLPALAILAEAPYSLSGGTIKRKSWRVRVPRSPGPPHRPARARPRARPAGVWAPPAG